MNVGVNKDPVVAGCNRLRQCHLPRQTVAGSCFESATAGKGAKNRDGGSAEGRLGGIVNAVTPVACGGGGGAVIGHTPNHVNRFATQGARRSSHHIHLEIGGRIGVNDLDTVVLAVADFLKGGVIIGLVALSDVVPGIHADVEVVGTGQPPRYLHAKGTFHTGASRQRGAVVVVDQYNVVRVANKGIAREDYPLHPTAVGGRSANVAYGVADSEVFTVLHRIRRGRGIADGEIGRTQRNGLSNTVVDS